MWCLRRRLDVANRGQAIAHVLAVEAVEAGAARTGITVHVVDTGGAVATRRRSTFVDVLTARGLLERHALVAGAARVAQFAFHRARADALASRGGETSFLVEDRDAGQRARSTVSDVIGTRRLLTESSDLCRLRAFRARMRDQTCDRDEQSDTSVHSRWAFVDCLLTVSTLTPSPLMTR